MHGADSSQSKGKIETVGSWHSKEIDVETVNSRLCLKGDTGTAVFLQKSKTTWNEAGDEAGDDVLALRVENR